MDDVAVSTDKFRLPVHCLESAGPGRQCLQTSYSNRINTELCFAGPVPNVCGAGSKKLIRESAKYLLAWGTQRGSLQRRQCGVAGTGDCKYKHSNTGASTGAS